MTLHVNVGGTWKEAATDGLSINVGGTWKAVDFGYVNISGTWKEFYVRDTTGPAVPTNLVAQWTGGVNCTVSWTNPADSDYASMEIRRYREGVGMDAPVWTVAAPTETWVDANVPDYWRIYTYYLTPIDTRGNRGTTVTVASMAWTGVARGRFPSPWSFDPVNSGTCKSGAWRTDISPTTKVYQGAAGTAVANIGVYFYGLTPFNTLRGAVVTGMNITTQRIGSGGQGAAVEPEMYWSTIASKASVPTPGVNMYDYFEGTGMCINGNCLAYVTSGLPSGWYDNWFSPTATRAQSVAFYSTDTTLRDWIGNVSHSYMQMYEWNTTVATHHPGRITVTHEG